VFLDDAMRHPLRFAKAGLDLSAGQAAIAARAAQRAFGRGNRDPVAPGDNRFADGRGRRTGVPNACRKLSERRAMAQQLSILTRSRRPA